MATKGNKVKCKRKQPFRIGYEQPLIIIKTQTSQHPTQQAIARWLTWNREIWKLETNKQKPQMQTWTYFVFRTFQVVECLNNETVLLQGWDCLAQVIYKWSHNQKHLPFLWPVTRFSSNYSPANERKLPGFVPDDNVKDISCFWRWTLKWSSLAKRCKRNKIMAYYSSYLISYICSG